MAFQGHLCGDFSVSQAAGPEGTAAALRDALHGEGAVFRAVQTPGDFFYNTAFLALQVDGQGGGVELSFRIAHQGQHKARVGGRRFRAAPEEGHGPPGGGKAFAFQADGGILGQGHQAHGLPCAVRVRLLAFHHGEVRADCQRAGNLEAFLVPDAHQGASGFQGGENAPLVHAGKVLVGEEEDVAGSFKIKIDRKVHVHAHLGLD